jgi:hypothetical protein
MREYGRLMEAGMVRPTSSTGLVALKGIRQQAGIRFARARIFGN